MAGPKAYYCPIRIFQSSRSEKTRKGLPLALALALFYDGSALANMSQSMKGTCFLPPLGVEKNSSQFPWVSFLEAAPEPSATADASGLLRVVWAFAKQNKTILVGTPDVSSVLSTRPPLCKAGVPTAGPRAAQRGRLKSGLSCNCIYTC